MICDIVHTLQSSCFPLLLSSVPPFPTPSLPPSFSLHIPSPEHTVYHVQYPETGVPPMFTTFCFLGSGSLWMILNLGSSCLPSLRAGSRACFTPCFSSKCPRNINLLSTGAATRGWGVLNGSLYRRSGWEAGLWTLPSLAAVLCGQSCTTYEATFCTVFPSLKLNNGTYFTELWALNELMYIKHTGHTSRLQ